MLVQALIPTDSTTGDPNSAMSRSGVFLAPPALSGTDQAPNRLAFAMKGAGTPTISVWVAVDRGYSEVTDWDDEGYLDNVDWFELEAGVAPTNGEIHVLIPTSGGGLCVHSG